jgi:hypothetical protein
MRWLLSIATASLVTLSTQAADPWLTYPGGDGPGKGKHVVLISGDEEYRSEEALPMLARMLSERFGFTCTVHFAIDPKDGNVNPNVNTNIPGLEALKAADLMVIFTRWRNLPDEQMKFIVDYIDAGKPVVGLRTATHAFKPGMKGPYAKFNSSGTKDYPGGFGRQVLGETWVNHHGQHGKQGTRGILTAAGKSHPIFRGVEPGSIFGTTDVYTVKLGDECVPLVLGEVTETLDPGSAAVKGPKNDPMMPVAWTKTNQGKGGSGLVFTTTMGAPPGSRVSRRPRTSSPPVCLPRPPLRKMPRWGRGGGGSGSSAG